MKTRLHPVLAVLGVIIILISAFWFMQSYFPKSTQPVTPTPTPKSNPTVTSTPSMPKTTVTADPIRVKITDFSMVDKQWSPIGGLVCDCRFSLSIENEGISNLTGLELKVRLFNNGNEVHVGNYFVCAFANRTLAETLHSGEVRVCDGTLMCTVGDSAYCTNLASEQVSIIAQVILNNQVLDQKNSQ